MTKPTKDRPEEEEHEGYRLFQGGRPEDREMLLIALIVGCIGLGAFVVVAIAIWGVV